LEAEYVEKITSAFVLILLCSNIVQKSERGKRDERGTIGGEMRSREEL
jgi:hypothetical protein